MQPRMKPRLALVFGGTGTIGAEVLRGLAEQGVAAIFTYFKNEEKANALSTEFSQEGFRVNLSEPRNVREFFKQLDSKGLNPDVVLYCAGRNCAKSLAETTDEDWSELQTVNCHSAFVACQQLAARIVPQSETHVVLLSALDRGQSLPLPVAFATSQGMLGTMAMAMAKELGPRGVRINVLALGALEGGISRDLNPKLLADYKNFSALRRVGTAREAAQAALWLALENSYMNGKVFSANGGI